MFRYLIEIYAESAIVYAFQNVCVRTSQVVPLSNQVFKLVVQGIIPQSLAEPEREVPPKYCELLFTIPKIGFASIIQSPEKIH